MIFGVLFRMIFVVIALAIINKFLGGGVVDIVVEFARSAMLDIAEISKKLANSGGVDSVINGFMQIFNKITGA